MNISLMAMFKILSIQCLLTMIFAIPLHLGNADPETDPPDVSVELIDKK